MLKRAATPQSFWPDGCPSSILLLSAWTNAFSGLDIQLQRVPTQNVAAVQSGRFCLILSKNNEAFLTLIHSIRFYKLLCSFLPTFVDSLRFVFFFEHFWTFLHTYT